LTKPLPSNRRAQRFAGTDRSPPGGTVNLETSSMAKLPSSQLKRGQVIDLDGEHYSMLKLDWVKPGQGPAYMQAKMRNLSSGKIIDRRLRSAETVEVMHVETRRATYSYDAGHAYVFMDTVSYEQIEAPKDVITADELLFLTSDAEVEIQAIEGQIVSVSLPASVVLEITQADPGLKKVAATDVSKPATTETGLKVNVPVFINVGDKIKVSTEDGKYLERVSTG
jgi:elongation factor P